MLSGAFLRKAFSKNHRCREPNNAEARSSRSISRIKSGVRYQSRLELRVGWDNQKTILVSKQYIATCYKQTEPMRYANRLKLTLANSPAKMSL